MAEVHAFDRVGAGNDQRGGGVAQGNLDEIWSDRGLDAGIGNPVRVLASTLVPGLVPAFVALGFLFQPVYWSLFFGGFFYFYPDPRRLWTSLGG